MKKAVITLLGSIITLLTNGQYPFISSGKIQYEKRTNQFKLLDGWNMEASMRDEVKRTTTKILVDRFDLLFSGDQSLYKLSSPNNENKYFAAPTPSETDFTIKDIAQRQLSFQKDVFGTTFNVEDTLSGFQWKIFDETRTIAGFECKKAVTRVFDSVYVIAFFTTEILGNHGPENFCGLPGMILEIAIPRLYTTWVATKLELNKPSQAELTRTIKGKKLTNEEYLRDLNKIGAELPADAKKTLLMFCL